MLRQRLCGGSDRPHPLPGGVSARLTHARIRDFAFLDDAPLSEPEAERGDNKGYGSGGSFCRRFLSCSSVQAAGGSNGPHIIL